MGDAVAEGVECGVYGLDGGLEEGGRVGVDYDYDCLNRGDVSVSIE